MYNQSESLVSTLCKLALQSIKNNKKVQYRLSEVKLKRVRTAITDLTHLKALPCNLTKGKLQVFWNERLLELKKQEKKLIEYRLKA